MQKLQPFPSTIQDWGLQVQKQLLYQVTDALSLYLFWQVWQVLTSLKICLECTPPLPFSWYPKAGYLFIKGFHHQRLYSKTCDLNLSGLSKILWMVTVTKISFSVVQNTCNKFFFYASNLLKQSFENIILSEQQL